MHIPQGKDVDGMEEAHVLQQDVGEALLMALIIGRQTDLAAQCVKIHPICH